MAPPLNNARWGTPAAAKATRRVKGISGRACGCAVQRLCQQSLLLPTQFPCTAPCVLYRQHMHYPALVSQLRPLLVCATWCSGITSFSLTLPSGCKACLARVKTEETPVTAHSLTLLSSFTLVLARPLGAASCPLDFSSSMVFVATKNFDSETCHMVCVFVCVLLLLQDFSANITENIFF